MAAVPAVLPALAKAGIQVLVETGAGESAGYPDTTYVEKGATIALSRADVFARADIVLQVRGYGAARETGRKDLPLLRAGQAVIGFQDPLGAGGAARELAATGATVLSMELMPRITRAQSMDALSSMATIAGYKAVLLAADALPRMFPMLMTAAGTITPARVLVVGAGVAGLQAIATARRLGAIVSGYDVRPAVKEQIESLGAKFVELPLEAKDSQDAGGYAKAQSEDFLRRQRELLARVVGESDVVITTALVPGRRAPVIVTAEMMAGMAPGSVVVDLAAEQGGNCALTRAGETVVEGGVSVLGPVNIASTVPFHASLMYAKNCASFLAHLVKKGVLTIDLEDEITRETLVARGGEVVHARLREAASAHPTGSAAAVPKEKAL